MKILLAYWIAGCAIIGIANAQIANECPAKTGSVFEVAAAVATWPSFVFGAFVYRSDGLKCGPAPTTPERP